MDIKLVAIQLNSCLVFQGTAVPLRINNVNRSIHVTSIDGEYYADLATVTTTKVTLTLAVNTKMNARIKMSFGSFIHPVQ